MNSSLQPFFRSLNLCPSWSLTPNFCVCLLLSLWLKLPAVFGWSWAKQIFCSGTVSVIPQVCPASSQLWAGFALTQHILGKWQISLSWGWLLALHVAVGSAWHWHCSGGSPELVGVAHWVHAQGAAPGARDMQMLLRWSSGTCRFFCHDYLSWLWILCWHTNDLGNSPAFIIRITCPSFLETAASLNVCNSLQLNI